MNVFPTLICRICERETFLIDISIAKNQRYLEMFLACANVTVRTLY